MTDSNQVSCYSCDKEVPVFVAKEFGGDLGGHFCPVCHSLALTALKAACNKEPYRAPPRCEDLISALAQKHFYEKERARTEAYAKAAKERDDREAEERERIDRIKAAEAEFTEQHRSAQLDEERRLTRQEMVRKELAARALAARHLLPFVKRNNPGYEAGWVHKDICRRLERFSQQVANRESPRLMLFMPPRAGKSELASKTFPAWHLGKHPTHDVITTSYSASLATDFSKKVRSLMWDADFQNVFPGVGVDKDNKNAEGWNTTKGGMYVPAGVEGPITGRGAHILVIDDPVKNREEGESATRRQAVYDWYTSTAYTRLAPGGGVLLIMTRWHEDDLAGRLLAEAEEGGEQWEVVKYPAVAVEDEEYRNVGDPLHPERYDAEALARIKKAIGRRDWQALYQQDPIGEEGDYFNGADLQYYLPHDRPPLEEMTIYSAWDLAIGQKAHNDFTVGVVFGIDRQKNLWMLDLYKGRWGSLEIVDKLFEMYQRWKPDITGIERTHVEQSIGPFLTEQKRARNLYSFRIEPLKHGNRDKIARAAAIRGLVEMHRVYLPKLAPWVDDFVSVLLKFPNGKHDDDVDAIAWLGQMVEMFLTRMVKPPPKRKSWRDQLDKYIQSGGDTGSHMAS